MRRLHRRILAAIILLTVSIILSRVAYRGAPGSSTVARPQHAVQRAAAAVHGWFGALRDLMRQPDRLVEVDAQLRALETAHAALQRELSELRELRALQDELAALTPPRRFTVGRVVAAQFAPQAQTLTVHLPSSEVVAIGDAVLESGALIGTVLAVERHRAIVLLLSDPRARIVGAARSTSSHPIGIVAAAAGGGIALTHIPRDADVAGGQVIMTAASDLRVPSGLPIGRVVDVRLDVDGFFRTAVLDAIGSATRPTFVTVVHQGE